MVKGSEGWMRRIFVRLLLTNIKVGANSKRLIEKDFYLIPPGTKSPNDVSCISRFIHDFISSWFMIDFKMYRLH
ncbi:hypothetical protein EEL32_02035 [Brevibacillus laterosporus]|nr:hypothetical protein EEL32_02035 [Brevibacillus laterosporus]